MPPPWPGTSASIRRLLAASDPRPHWIQGWLHSPDSHFREKMTEITAWNRERAHPFRCTFTGYPSQVGAAVEAPKAA